MDPLAQSRLIHECFFTVCANFTSFINQFNVVVGPENITNQIPSTGVGNLSALVKSTSRRYCCVPCESIGNGPKEGRFCISNSTCYWGRHEIIPGYSKCNGTTARCSNWHRVCSTNFQYTSSSLLSEIIDQLIIVFFCSIFFRFEVNFGGQTVLLTFKCAGNPDIQFNQPKVCRKGNRMEIIV